MCPYLWQRFSVLFLGQGFLTGFYSDRPDFRNRIFFQSSSLHGRCVVTRYTSTSHRWLIAYETHVVECLESCDEREHLHLSEKDEWMFFLDPTLPRNHHFLVIVFQSFGYSVGIGNEPIESVWVHNKGYLVAVYCNGLLLKDLFFVLPQFGSEPSGNTGTSNCFLKTGIQIRKHPIHHQGKLKPVVWTDLNQIFVIAIKFCAGDNIITFGTILVE